jgi:hypothetical protein
MEDFPLLGIYRFDLSRIRLKAYYLNINDFHHQIRFLIWNETPSGRKSSNSSYQWELTKLAGIAKE